MINLSASINTIPIPDAARSALAKKGFKVVGELLSESEENLSRIKGVGESFARTIRVYFKRHGMVLNSPKAAAAVETDGPAPTVETEIRRLLPATSARAISELNKHFGNKSPEVRAGVKKHSSFTFAKGTERENEILLPADRKRDFRLVMDWVEEVSAREGGLSVADVISRFDLQHRWFVSMDNIIPLLNEIYDLVWLDREYGWFWIRDARSPLAHQAMMTLSLVRQMTAKEMKRTLDRWYRANVQDAPLPHTPKAILGLCAAMPEYCFVDGEAIVASNDLRPVQVINVNPERAIFKAFVDVGAEKHLTFDEIKETAGKTNGTIYGLKKALEACPFIEREYGLYRLIQRRERE